MLKVTSGVAHAADGEMVGILRDRDAFASIDTVAMK